MGKAVLLALAGAAVLAAAASAITTNGFPDEGRHGAVGAILVPTRDGTGYGLVCSGTLVAERYFLTASHCTAFLQADPRPEYVTFDDLTSADVKSGSGDLTARAVQGEARAKTGSGDIQLEAVHGSADLVSGSGDVSVRRAEGDVLAKTGSGDVSIGASVGDLEIMTGTGDVTLGAVHGGSIRAKTGTGDVSIGVAAGVAALLDLNTVTGDVKIDLTETDGPGDSEARAHLSVHSGSGDIKIRRAQVTLA